MLFPILQASAFLVRHSARRSTAHLQTLALRGVTARFMSGDRQLAKDQLDRLAKKMSHVEELERHVADLEANYAVKHDAYNNIGMQTAAEIDALFADSKLKKDSMKNTLSELKALINEAKAIFESASK
jgi:hypothetical protein